MDDLGPPVSHLVLDDGTPVYDRDGRRIGVVEQAMTDEATGIFEGLVIHTHPLPGRHVYAGHEQIAELRERGVRLAVGEEDLHELREPSRPRRGLSAGSWERRLRHAWDWLTEAR
jgi:sporulation protein YlmC with PRC-barrel domain